MKDYTQKVWPGFNQNVRLTHFSQEEKNIINVLSKEWYVTNGGREIIIGPKISYKYILIKPTDKYRELFNIEREIPVVFSSYDKFEPRTYDAFDQIYKEYQDLRIEKIAGIVISKDNDICKTINSLTKSDEEHQVIIPFHYGELHDAMSDYFIVNRVKQFFYSRDLFAFQSALKKELYFFGRSALIHKIIDRHESHENSGLFGLRKTGKTSIVYGIKRVLDNKEIPSVYIDCQSPSFHMRHWNTALKYVINEIKKQNHIEAKLHEEQKYTLENAALCFEADIIKLQKKCCDKCFMLIFDEIEHITPYVASSTHWRNETDFVYFWQTLRSISQKHSSLFTYLIVGTNPYCIETVKIKGIDNPIFDQIPPIYIPSFSITQTKEMVEQLGGIMGLQFDESIYTKLTDDLGGHPFLIRKVCSMINSLVDIKDRPVRIDPTLYSQAYKKFLSSELSYIEMILSVLNEYYRDEYDMLTFLAIDDIETFKNFANESPIYTNHLIGYNIIDRNRNNFFFKIDAIKQYLANKNRYTVLHQTQEDKRKEISSRRNQIEPKLRIITRQVLSSQYGPVAARKQVLDILGDPRKTKYSTYNLKDIFDANKCEIYWEDIRKIIEAHWEKFEHIFNRDRASFSTYMKTINTYRVDAHAKDIGDDEMQLFRVHIKKLEEYCDNFI